MKDNIFAISLKIDDLIINSVFNKMSNQVTKIPSMSLHTHCFNEIFAVINGGLSVEFTDGNTTFKKGDICIIPEGVFHYATASENSNVISVRFDFSKDKNSDRKGIFEKFTLSIKDSKTKVLSIPNKALCENFIKAYSELEKPTFTSDIYVKALFTQIYVEIFRELNSQAENNLLEVQLLDSDSALRVQIEDSIYRNFNEKITAKEFAEKLHFSERQLNRILNKFYGKSFKVLLTDFRLERGAKLLVSTDSSIEEIAYLCGYLSVKNFSIAFNNKFSTTPKNYRRLQKLQ